MSTFKNLDALERSLQSKPEPKPKTTNKASQKVPAKVPPKSDTPDPADVKSPPGDTEIPIDYLAPPETAVTKEGRMDVAQRALGPVAPEPELSESEKQIAEAYQRMYPDRELDMSPMGIRTREQWYDSMRSADRPEADAAQRRYEIVQELEEVYGGKGLTLPEEYNVPHEERGIAGKFEEGLADVLPYLSLLLPDFREASRKRKADIMPEPYFPERIAELASYPERAAVDLVAGTELSKPYTEMLGKTVRERPQSWTRPEVEAGNRMYGLRHPSAIEDEIKQLQQLEKNKWRDYSEFYNQNNPEKATRDPQFKGLLEHKARQHMEAKSAPRVKRLDALHKELDLIKKYIHSLREQ